MSFAIFKGETSMKELVSRLFSISGKGSAAKADQVAKALLQANPQLKDMSKVPVGSMINVPATAPPLNQGEEAPSVPPPSSPTANRIAIAAQAQQTLDSLAQRLSDIDSQAAAGANAFVALARAQQAQSVTPSSPQLKEHLPNLIAAAQAAVKTTKAGQDARAKVLADMQTNLQIFAQGTQNKS